MAFFQSGYDDDDEEDVEMALVCPTQTLGDLNNVKQQRVDKKEKQQKQSQSHYESFKRGLVNETFQCVVALFILVLVLGGVVLSYFFCPACLFGIMVVSACLCPFLPYFNIPLWTSILLIVLMGMTYTQRPFTVIWK